MERWRLGAQRGRRGPREKQSKSCCLGFIFGYFIIRAVILLAADLIFKRFGREGRVQVGVHD